MRRTLFASVEKKDPAMKRFLTPGSILGVVAVVIAMTGSAYAATAITGKQIKDGTIQSRDVKKGAINRDRLSQDVQASLNKADRSGTTVQGSPLAGSPGATGAKGDKGANGADGASGATGANGKDGANGAIGPQGIPGAKGDKGDTGPQGPAGLFLVADVPEGSVAEKPLTKIGGPIKTGVTPLTTAVPLQPGKYLVTANGIFHRSATAVAGDPDTYGTLVLWLDKNDDGVYDWQDGEGAGTAFTSAIPANPNREASASETHVINVTQPTKLLLGGFGYNSDSSGYGSNGVFSVVPSLSVLKLDG